MQMTEFQVANFVDFLALPNNTVIDKCILRVNFNRFTLSN